MPGVLFSTFVYAASSSACPARKIDHRMHSACSGSASTHVTPSSTSGSIRARAFRPRARSCACSVSAFVRVQRHAAANLKLACSVHRDPQAVATGLSPSASSQFNERPPHTALLPPRHATADPGEETLKRAAEPSPHWHRHLGDAPASGPEQAPARPAPARLESAPPTDRTQPALPVPWHRAGARPRAGRGRSCPGSAHGTSLF